jgi:protein SCO1/2
VHQGLVKAVKGNGLRLGQDFLGVSVSIDPKEDPKYAASNQGRLARALLHEKTEDWPFLMDLGAGLGAKALADAVGFRYKLDPTSGQYAHAAVAVVLAPDGKIARYLYGVDFAPRDVRLAVVEASEGRVGTTLDRVLLTCFKYDPMTQRYTPYAIGFVRIGAFMSFLALAGLLVVLWRRELQMRRRKAAV